MAELGQGLIDEEAKSTGVQVEMLDYDYVEKCNDVKELKAILSVLQSGKEGHYPHLIQTVEDKLMNLLPAKDKQKLLRIKQQASPQEIFEAEKDIRKWEEQVVREDIFLKTIFETDKSNEIYVEPSGKKLPPVRGSKVVVPVSSTVKSKTSSSESKGSPSPEKKPDTISGYDFRAWEKYDVEKALEELEKHEETRLAQQQGTQTAAENRDSLRRSKAHHKEMEKALTTVHANDLSDIQRSRLAERERQKGNEYYRTGENDKAYDCYTTSIALENSNAVVFANRAMACIRLEKFDTAEDDCSRALMIDKSYLKAWSRRGMTRFKKGKYFQAAQDFAEAIALDPANKELLSLFDKARNKIAEVEGKTVDLSTFRIQNNIVGDSVNLKERDDSEAFVSPQVVASFKELCLPISTSELVQVGRAVMIDDESSEGFTRVEIIEEDDTVNEEDDMCDSFTRVPIIEEEDDEEEEEEGGFTRVAIIEEADETHAVVEPDPEPVVEEDERLQWKNRGNGLLSQGKYAEAVQAYSTSLALDPSYLPSLLNRSLAFLHLKSYDRTIQDTCAVLAKEPRNLKALYRRALAYKCIAQELDDLSEKRVEKLLAARADLQNLHEIDGGNAEAMTTLDEVSHLILSTSQRWKDMGNDAMKRGQFQVAVDCYSSAIDIDPASVLLFNNRSQAYLKLEKYVDAERDASIVIERASAEGSGDASEAAAQKKKALFRRGLARRGLADLDSALRDFDLLLVMEPSNKTAEVEKNKTEILIRERQKSRSTPPSARASEAPLDLKPVSTKRKEAKESLLPPPPSTEASSPAVRPPPAPATVAEKKAAKAREVVVPTEPPKTEYELERVWRSLKTRPDLFVKYLECFTNKTFKKILKGSVSSDLFSSLFSALLEHGSVDLCRRTLESFSDISGFSMTIKLLPAADELCLRNIFDKLRAESSTSDEALERLQAKYIK